MTRSIVLVAKSEEQSVDLRLGFERFCHRHRLPWRCQPVMQGNFLTALAQGRYPRADFDAVAGFVNDPAITSWAGRQVLLAGFRAFDAAVDDEQVHVSLDLPSVTRTAVAHFIEQGLDCCASVDAEHRDPGIRRIHAAFIAACRECAIPCDIFPRNHMSDDTEPSAREAVLAQWLHDLPKPIGILAHQDRPARWLCGVCRQHGLKVPDEIAVLGVDDHVWTCENSEPQLSSVIVPYRHIGEQLASGLHRIWQSADEQISIVVPALAVRRRASTFACGSGDREMDEAARLLRDPAQLTVSIADIAKQLGLSRVHFTRRFRTAFGTTPQDMRQGERIARAKEQLLRTEQPPIAIARELGFASYPTFSTTFKRATGWSPTEFRSHAT
jgi:LacI family transcriptional regulator